MKLKLITKVQYWRPRAAMENRQNKVKEPPLTVAS